VLTGFRHFAIDCAAASAAITIFIVLQFSMKPHIDDIFADIFATHITGFRHY